jgi:hypothetical protein
VSLRYGFQPNQKVVNIVTRQRFRSVTAEVRGGGATEGGRASGTGEANLLRIQGDNRFNVDVEYARAGRLLEGDRDIVTTNPRAPFSVAGNVTGAAGPGSEIDPALSRLAGTVVRVAPVPGTAAAGRPALADFVAGANVAGTTDLSDFRTLLPATEQLSINAVLARPLSSSVSASLNGRCS